MTTAPAAARATDPALKDKVNRLIQFLKDLVTARAVPVRQMTGHLDHLWLDQVRDLALLDAEATAGGELLRLSRVVLEPAPALPALLQGWVPVTERDNSALEAPQLRSEGPDADGGGRVPLEERPEVALAYDSWLPEWQRWATRDRPQRRLHQTYDQLRTMRQQTLENPESVEAVVAGGLLVLPDDGVRTHVLTHRVTVEIEVETGDVVVKLDSAAVTSLEDGRVLTGLDCFDDGGTAVLRGRIAELDVRPASDNALTFLKEWATRAVLQPVDVSDGWSAPSGTTTSLTLAPAIVLRQRGAYALQEYYTDIERTLAENGEAVPLGLAQLVESIEAEDRIAWLEATGATAGADVAEDPLFPLPANEEQAQIIRRLRNDTGVVVEGPPGTGKTHTIANLMSALLARGQRVLVTSEKAQALKVLRDKLPAEMQELCVSITDAGRGGSLELSKSVSRLAAEHSSYNPEKAQRLIDDVAGKLRQARTQRAGILEEIRALREAETYQNPEVAPGYAGTLARIAERVAAAAEQFAWMPVPATGALPLTPAEFDELRGQLPGDTDVRRRRRDQSLPPAQAVPDLQVVRRLAKDVARGADARASRSGPLADVLGQIDATTLADLISVCAEIRDGLDGLSAGVDASWAMPVLDGVLRRDNELLWQQVGQARQLVDEAQAMNAQVGFRDVQLATEVSPAPVAQVFADLAQYLHGGGALKKLFKSDQQKAAEPYLPGASVEGQPVTTAEQAHLVALHLHTLARLQAFASATAMVAIPGGVPGPRALQVSHAHRVVQTIGAIETLRAARDRLAAQLSRIPAMPRVDLVTTLGVRNFVDVAAVFADVEIARRAADELERLATSLESTVERSQRPPELDAAVEALRNADAETFQAALLDLEAAGRERRAQLRCDELSQRLGTTAPGLLALLRETARDEVWVERTPLLAEAWSWACAATFVRERTAPGREEELDRRLTGVDRDVAKLTAELAANQAWKACLERMNATQVTALQAYRDSMANVGKGSGKYAQRYRLAAREAMTAAQEAVPAWVMPLQEVLASIPPQQSAFDVVIVDEASQVGIENLFLLWLAPRVIVVGDDKQCTPSEVKHGALDKVFDRLDTLLPDIPNYLRSTLTPRSSVFSILRTRFGQVIRLREHFRCMPEIITWSSQMFYRDAPLVPVRQHGADRLPPLKTTFVPGAYIQGANSSLRNEVEAEAIVEALVGCLHDPAYDGKTFGVVVLQGHAQVDVIREALLSRVEPEEWERRNIRIGTPPDFQGDERDVILLSLVTAPDHKRASQTRLDAQRSYNVAASRARDQLWLFHSVMADQLRTDDLRSQLLTYMASMPVAAAAAMPDDVPEDERHPDFDSLFEQRVFRRIQQRGYHVTPQVEVNGRRIDLVVTGAQGKLAVECDGDAWHSSPEQVASDFARELELRRCGWQFWRIRESRYYLDPDGALADLWTALDRRGIGPARITTDGESVADWTPLDLPATDDAAEGEVDEPSDDLAGGVPDVSATRVPVTEPRRAAYVPTPPLAPAPVEAVVATRSAESADVPPAVAEPGQTVQVVPAPAAGPGIVPNGRAGTFVDEETRALVLELASDGALTNEVVRQFLGVGADEARRVLLALTDEGLLEKRGATKGTHYVLTGSGDAPSSSAIGVVREGIHESVRSASDVTDDDMAQLVLELANRGPLTNEMVRHLLDVDRVVARRLLGRLADEGLLKLRGAGRGAHYVLAEEAEPVGSDADKVANRARWIEGFNRQARTESADQAPSAGRDESGSLPEGMGAGTAPLSEKAIAALKIQFGHRLRRDLQEVARRCNYRPTYYQRLLTQQGGWVTARQLLADPKVHDGLARLWELGMLQHSLEAAVLDPAYRELFMARELETARRRLSDLGYSVDA
ncbi:AAA domain-containing protein [Geodermatophilus sp. SYSU D00705]